MARDGLLIGEVAKRTGATRKALRLYEEAGVLAAPRRTIAGYRIYAMETLDLLAFVRQAQRLGFSLDEIEEIVSIQRSGRLPCPHVHDLVAGGHGAERLPSAFISNSRTDGMGGEGMEKRVSLCPMCDHCPEVALVGDEVQIGEAGNLVVLKKAEWNVVVEAIKSGRLSKV